MTIPSSIWVRGFELNDIHNIGTSDVLASDHRFDCSNQFEYVLKSDPEPDLNPMRKCGFSGGRENTPFAEVVPCSYYRSEQGEVSVEITGKCSLATLERIVDWFKRQTVQKTNSSGERYRVFAGDEK